MAKAAGDTFTWGDAREYTKEIKARYPTRGEVTTEIGESEPKPIGRVDLITRVANVKRK